MYSNLRRGSLSSFHSVFFPSNNLSSNFCISFCTSCFYQRQFRSPVKFTSRVRRADEETESNSKDDSQLDKDLDILLNKTYLGPGSNHQVLVIQPYIKWGRDKKRNTTPELQLLESVKLIQTLRDWKVVDKFTVSLRSIRKNSVFGKGNLETLQRKIRSSAVISAVFISISTLSFRQQMLLQQTFGVPVFDRYSIIMHIFKEHAHTKEARLQVEKAQLPYLFTVLKGLNHGFNNKLGIDGYTGGEISSLSTRKEIFRKRQAKLNKKILELREYRERLRIKRDKTEIPTVAVLGYTNAGKTSLIKALTGKKTLEPQDYLFATLDVTCHLGQLPCGLNVYYIDTLGFISDIPTYLIESFVSTLEDAVSAHVIIHVRDLSHPDTILQNDNVIKTLKDLNLSEESLKNIITVGNKIDLIKNNNEFENEDMVLVSSTNGTGINILKKEIERKVLLQTNKIQMTIRVASGSEEYNWIHEHSSVSEESIDLKNSQFTFLKVIISPSVLGKFKHKFITNYNRS